MSNEKIAPSHDLLSRARISKKAWKELKEIVETNWPDLLEIKLPLNSSVNLVEEIESLRKQLKAYELQEERNHLKRRLDEYKRTTSVS